MPLQEFFQWTKKFIMQSDLSKGNVDQKRGIKEANTFFCIRANVNFSSSLKSKRNLLFPAEFHAKILVLAKLHKLINNSKQFFAKWKLLRGQDRISIFFCKLSQTDRDLGKAQILWIKGTNYSAFLLMSALTRFSTKTAVFVGIFSLILVCFRRNLRKERVKMSMKTAILFENFVKKTDLD
jgi:hypothetical protein